MRLKARVSQPHPLCQAKPKHRQALPSEPDQEPEPKQDQPRNDTRFPAP